MKKTAVLFAFIFSLKMNAQNVLVYDSMPRHEVSASFLPVFSFIINAGNNSPYTNFNFSYKYNFKNKTVFRSSFSYFPFTYHDGGYVQTPMFIDTLFLLDDISLHQNVKVQFNIGFEKIFRAKRFIHGYGGEFFVNRKTFSFYRLYRWYPVKDLWSGALYDSKYMSQYTTYNGSGFGIYNVVDSLSTRYTLREVRYGLQLFYSLKYQINKRFIINSTVGSYFALVQGKYLSSEGKDAYKYKGTYYAFDQYWNPLFFGDISLAYRF
jgi:hypothetical protein